jgi:D-xylulose reductase
MRALVLERKGKLSLRDIDLVETLGSRDVRVAIKSVGVCGSDIHYYLHGAIGQFVVRKPMILGHEAAGDVIEVGEAVEHLKVGDRVCMEPGIPNFRSRTVREGRYNVDPDVAFWATPPVHGVTRPYVVHPADFCYKLPSHISYQEGAMVEPLAIGMHAARTARIKPGDVAVVIGAGTIGLVTTLAALAGGCSQVIVTDIAQPRLDLAATLGPVVPVNVRNESVVACIAELTSNWGADIVFEASGSKEVAGHLFEMLNPGGTIVYIGMPESPVLLDIVSAQAKEATIQAVWQPFFKKVISRNT